MELLIEATRDCPLIFDGQKVVSSDADLPLSRKRNNHLGIRVYGDILEQPTHLEVRQLLGIINCDYFTTKSEADSSKDSYVYEILGADSDVLVCTLDIDLDYANSSILLHFLHEVIAETFKEKFNTKSIPVIAVYTDKSVITKFKTFNHYGNTEIHNEDSLIIMYP